MKRNYVPIKPTEINGTSSNDVISGTDRRRRVSIATSEDSDDRASMDSFFFIDVPNRWLYSQEDIAEPTLQGPLPDGITDSQKLIEAE